MEENASREVIAKISQDTLVEMVGTTRFRGGFFLNKFRNLGFIGYNGKLHLTGWLHMHSSLLKIGLHD
ncbi:MAG TPA: hypothetical protein VGQ08_06655 [Nitrospiraceae bacterium]|nr:hypothetical protein [Nitrospiraceae bacterium]